MGTLETLLTHVKEDEGVEELVLGAMIRDSGCAAEGIDMLTEQAFARPSNRALFAGIVEVVNAHGRVSLPDLWERLQRTRAAQFLGAERLVELSESSYVGDFGSWARKLVDATRRRETVALARDLCGLVERGARIDEIESRITDWSECSTAVRVGAPTTLRDDDVDAAWLDAGSSQSSLAWAFGDHLHGGFCLPPLGELLGAPRPGEVLLVAARPSMGKTDLLLNEAVSMAAGGCHVLFLSLEMTKEQLYGRMIARRADLDSRVFDHPLDPATRERARAAWDAIKGYPLLLDDRSHSVGSLASTIRRAKISCGVQVVCVDYLQLVSARGDGYERISTVSNTIKRLAKQTGTQIIAATQLNRGPDVRDNHRPQLSDLRDSGSLEQDADQVLFLYRPHYYNQSHDPADVELILRKNRRGEAGSRSVRFNASRHEFAER